MLPYWWITNKENNTSRAQKVASPTKEARLDKFRMYHDVIVRFHSRTYREIGDRSVHRGVRRILVRGVNAPPCHLRRRKFWKFDYEMVHCEVNLNKYVVSIAPFFTPACPDCSKNIQKTVLFCRFSLFNFSSIFPGGSADPICPYVWTLMSVHEICEV